MNFTAILLAALVVGLVGIILGFFLGISGEKFKVEVDPKEEAILENLGISRDVTFVIDEHEYTE